MKDYLDGKTRIVLKWHFTALDNVLALQRKKWYGWKTVSWIYPSIMKDATCKHIREWLEWKETYMEEKSTEREIGKKLISVCKGEF
jgi:hypothetical protein